MNISDYFDQTGDHKLSLPGKAGEIEAIITIPEQQRDYFAFIGHPHSLHGGTMDNKVVTTVAKAFRDLNIPSLRFNFRGVGHTSGQFDNGIGESEDLLCLIEALLKLKPDMNIILAGFSFGSYVVYRAAAQVQTKLLITIAPPVHHYNYQEYDLSSTPWVILQGDQDEIVPYDLVKAFVDKQPFPIQFVTFTDTSHFFHGKLIELKSKLSEVISKFIGTE